MTTLVSALNTVFTPGTGNFNVQATGGNAQLERRNTSGAAWAVVGPVIAGYAYVVDNSVGSTDYRLTPLSGTPVVQADQ